MARKYRKFGKKKKLGKWGRRFKTAKKWAGVAGSVAATAGQALSIASRVASMVNAEFKWVDNSALILDATTPFDSTNSIVYDITSAMVQGVGANEFVGQSVRLKSLYCRLRIVPNQSTSGNPWTSIRFMIVVDLNLDGTTPAVTDVLQTNSYLSPLTMNMPDRYSVLYDKTLTASNANNYAKNIKIFKKLNHHFKVSAASPTGS